MRVAELMQTNVRTISADATVAEAVQAMADTHVSGLPVVAGNGRVVGVVTTTDVLQAQAEAQDRRSRTELFEHTPVRDLMTPTPLTVAPDDDVREAARQMLYTEVHRLFVVDQDRLVGVISQTDIAHAVGTGRL
jgi:acetoin utilization protein AcuB